MSQQLAEQLAQRVMRKDFEGLRELLHPEIDYMGMTPGQFWEGYRFIAKKANGNYLVKQQAYLTELDGKIKWLRVMCSGMRPIPE